MLNAVFPGFDLWQLTVLALSAMLIGVNKTGIPGLGTVPVILLTLAFSARLSPGIQLVMLVMGDIAAVVLYRTGVPWKIVLKLLPWAFVGLGAGSWVIRHLEGDSATRLIIGAIVLGMSLMNLLRKRYREQLATLPGTWWFGGFFALLAGFTTHIANAAGPVMGIYLLTLNLPKDKYIRVSAWFFLILNWTKLPIFLSEGRITWPVVRADLLMIPFLLAGAGLGYWVLKKLKQEKFERIVELLVVVSAAYLCYKGIVGILR